MSQSFTPIRRKRGAYNTEHAFKFLVYFKKAIANPGSDLFLPSELFGWSTTTLHNRLSEALLWFTHNEQQPEVCEYKPKDFICLRGMINFTAGVLGDKEGVMIRFKKSNYLPVESDIVEIGQVQTSVEAKWKVELLGWLENSNNTDPLILEGAAQLGRLLSKEDIAWIERTLFTAGIEFQVEAGFIRAMK